MKQFILSLLLICASAGLMAQSFAGGTGTSTDPWLINTPTQLENMYDVDYGTMEAPTPRYYKLTADLDMTGVNWEPILSSSPYSKIIHFDGNGHIIKNLTCIGKPYAGLFGILLGSCKNLGLVDVDILSTSAGGGFGGYLGLKTPTTDWQTGIVENCYVTGKIEGSAAVGGLFGNMGRKLNEEWAAPTIKNCYSTARVVVNDRNANGAYAGGLVGELWDEAVIEHSYATGTVISYGTNAAAGAGGIVGVVDPTNMLGWVALNDSIINDAQRASIGRLAATVREKRKTVATAENSFALESIILKDFDRELTEIELLTDPADIVKDVQYDGPSKNQEYFEDVMNWFMDLGYDFVSDENVWSQDLRNGRPIFQWLANRSDHENIDGHDIKSGVSNISLASFNISQSGKSILLSSDNLIRDVRVFSISGQLVKSLQGSNSNQEITLDTAGAYVISVLIDGRWNNQKVILN